MGGLLRWRGFTGVRTNDELAGASRTMTTMTDEDRKAIAEAPASTLAEWWCLLNKWRWPHAGLGEPDPVPEKYDSNGRRGQIMNAICARIGIRECLREWNRDNVPGANCAAAKCSGTAARS